MSDKPLKHSENHNEILDSGRHEDVCDQKINTSDEKKGKEQIENEFSNRPAGSALIAGTIGFLLGGPVTSAVCASAFALGTLLIKDENNMAANFLQSTGRLGVAVILFHLYI